MYPIVIYFFEVVQLLTKVSKVLIKRNYEKYYYLPILIIQIYGYVEIL